jgi:hypothetical protein
VIESGHGKHDLETKTFAAACADTTFERHYRISDLAKIWNIGRETIRKIVATEPGVCRVRGGLLKEITHYSIPESVARRIHTRLLTATA